MKLFFALLAVALAPLGLIANTGPTTTRSEIPAPAGLPGGGVVVWTISGLSPSATAGAFNFVTGQIETGAASALPHFFGLSISPFLTFQRITDDTNNPETNRVGGPVSTLSGALTFSGTFNTTAPVFGSGFVPLRLDGQVTVGYAEVVNMALISFGYYDPTLFAVTGGRGGGGPAGTSATYAPAATEQAAKAKAQQQLLLRQQQQRR